MSKPKSEHIKDIDFRTREQRSVRTFEEMRDLIIKFYHEASCLDVVLDVPEFLQGQRSAYASLLWHILPKSEYNRIMKRKKSLF